MKLSNISLPMPNGWHHSAIDQKILVVGSVRPHWNLRKSYVGTYMEEFGFEMVTGSFNCSGNNLHTLVGAPIHVAHDFDCTNNPLDNLDGFPDHVGGITFIGANIRRPHALLQLCTIVRKTKELAIFKNPNEPWAELNNFIKTKDWKGDLLQFQEDLLEAGII